ncbi:MAG: glycosyltransferase family 9 protein [Actinomycetes bacterium]
METMLVLRALGLGDLLTGLPALRALSRLSRARESKLVLAAPPSLCALAAYAGVEHNLHPQWSLSPIEWRGRPPDVAVNLHGKGPESNRCLLRTRPSRLVAFSDPEAGVRGPEWDADEHEVDRWARLVSTELETAVDCADLKIARPPRLEGTDPDPYVVIHPGAASPSRRWPPERFAEVARWARSTSMRVYLTGSMSEEHVANEVQMTADPDTVLNVAGHTTLHDLMALVAHARLVVCGDTGVAHLATALGTPSVILFGPVPPSVWGPRIAGPHILLWHDRGHGDPHGSTLDPSLAAISVDEVIDSMRSLVAA